MCPVPAPTGGVPRQASLAELGRPLSDLTFVVVDLETTGGSPATSEITEIGAVRVRGGQILGEMSSLVRPSAPIPAFISVLTGITDAMVATAPGIGEVVPTFLEFARGAVLVAHNAPFDLGFLRAAATACGYPAPAWEHLDTVRIARRVISRDETRDCRLSSLAALFGSATQPNHRALADARATVDVLHGLFERLGNLGVTTIEDLHEYSARVSPAQRRKRHLADDLPTGPGVYVFRDGTGRPLYVGTSRSVRSRVRTYFTASEPRTRMAEMVAIAERVDAIECAHALEAEVRELRLIAEYKPPYNRRSRFPERAVYLRLTDEPFPRLSRVRSVGDGVTSLGPFGSAAAAESAATALLEAIPLRQCSTRLSPRRPTAACALAELGRCGAPCDGREGVAEYGQHVAAARGAMTADPRPVVDVLERRIARLSADQRYEEAAGVRDRLAAYVRAVARMQRLTALTCVDELVAAAPTADAGWDLAVVRRGRLVSAASVPRGTDPRPWVDAVVASAETVRPLPGPTPCASVEETERIGRWLAGPGVRLVRLDGEWSWPAHGAIRAARRFDVRFDGGLDNGFDRGFDSPTDTRRGRAPSSPRSGRSGREPRKR
ncbi:DEDD exonuclease domain-containing protein [Parafrankia sp. BMG5.11]|uniref:DEDD exonuclease domain-containing protein n=1 Tax=Parafrankia sp. BMG5.11 TaxID=222540 RepID=UPI00103E6919|nr:DEDD exonuclease domain-containing protein [Parafrankia sp. BMG5.11]TCJ35658.1 DEDD exonuclease domain-containing protein [Parafrankia sp. BMG5.11]